MCYYFKLHFFGWQNIGGGQLPPPCPPCSYGHDIQRLINPLQCFFSNEGHVALDRYPGPGYDTLLLRMTTGNLLSACPHRQFHTASAF